MPGEPLRDHGEVRPPALTGSASGAQRLVWLLPALLLLGIADTDLPTAVCAAVLVGATWQLLYRRALGERLVRLATCAAGAEALVLLDLATWPAQAQPAVAVVVIVAALIGTEHLLQVAERAYDARDEGTVPAGT